MTALLLNSSLRKAPPLRRLRAHFTFVSILSVALYGLASGESVSSAETAPTTIFHHGKIVTVDAKFHLAEALAVGGERMVAVGANDEVLALAGPETQTIDLHGKTVMPGLIDSHAHPLWAALYEFDHPVPEMDSVADVLQYIKSRAKVLKPGEWIGVQQVFITRLRDQRFPTRKELDQVAPNNPVFFRTGPDASVNSLALKLSGIDKDFQVTDSKAKVERDPKTGEPTGILRNCHEFIKYKPSSKNPTAADRRVRLKTLLAAYNEVGITGVTDRKVTDDDVGVYKQLKDRKELTCRVYLTYHVDPDAPWKEIDAHIQAAAEHSLHRYNNMLWLHGIKVFLDGGMLTGSAYMLKPWGVSKIYSIDDPEYRGLRFIQPDRLYQIARATMSRDLQITAHCVGDGALHALLEAYERVNKEFPISDKRPCVCHGNFMTAEAIEKMRTLGVVADMQPVWLYLDGSTLTAQFGDERLKYFQPYRTLFDRGVMVGGGSDHMQKIGRRRSINCYDPFLGMWAALSRQPRWTDKPLHPEQQLTREEAIRFYTTNNAYLTFEEKEKGSLEKGKLADFIVLDRDILTCPVDEVKDIEVLKTYLGGKPVYVKPE